MEKYPTIKLLTYQLDFSTASNKDYVELAKFISPHNISILVNNVGTNHEIPTPFIQEKMETLENIINVNVLSIVKMTRIVSELMSEKYSLKYIFHNK